MLVAVDSDKDIVVPLASTDSPLALLRGNSRLRLFVVHHDESAYVLKLIKLEQQKVGLDEWWSRT